MKILIIEDDANDMELQARELRRKGHEVIEAYSIDDGVRMALDRQPELIVSDLGMNGRGYNVAEYIKENENLNHIPVIALTGAHSHLAQSRARNFDGFLTKPLKPDELFEQYANARMRRRGERKRDASGAIIPPPNSQGDSEEPTGLSVEGPGGFSMKAYGINTILLLIAMGLAIMGALFWHHVGDNDKSMNALVEVNKGIHESIKTNEKTLRWLGCILATDTQNRDYQYRNPGSWCNREL